MTKTYFKKPLAVVVILLFTSVSVIPSTGKFMEQPSSMFSNYNILYVGGSGPGNYTNIQDAIDDASDGDTVFVYNGTYYESNISILKRIILMGEDKFSTIIDANSSKFDCINVYSDNVTITGFTIKKSNSSGIVIISINNTISDNIISDNFWSGINLIGIRNNISYNIISNNSLAGIEALMSNGIIIGNKIVDNNIGMAIRASSSTLIYYNNISNNDVGIQLIMTTDSSILKNNFYMNNDDAVFYRGVILEIRTKIRYEIFIKLFLKDLYDPYYKPLTKNIWSENYWNETRTFPKPIFGCLRFFGPRIITEIPVIINWVNFDWHPAQEPYDI